MAIDQVEKLIKDYSPELHKPEIEQELHKRMIAHAKKLSIELPDIWSKTGK